MGADYDDSPHTQTGDRVARLAVSGIRLVIEEFRTDVTKARKDGTPGALRIDYGDPRAPAEPIKWLWRFIDGAKTAGELAHALVAVDERAPALDYAEGELIAESVAWTSCQTVGLDSSANSIPYLASWAEQASLEVLERAAALTGRLADRIEQALLDDHERGFRDWLS